MNPDNFYSTVIKSKKYNPLTADEEKELARRIRANDHARESRNKLVCGNLRFAVLVAARYQGIGLSMEDLVQEANRGLIEAADRFDPEKNFKFVSYAVWWVRRYILFALNNHGRAVKVPQYSGALTIKVKEVIRELEQRYQRGPTDEEISRELGINKKWITILENTNHTASLNRMLGDDDIEAISALTYEENENPVDEQRVRILLDGITGREHDYVTQYYMGARRADLRDIAKRENLSRERVRQIIDKGIYRLRKLVKKSEVYV